MKQDYTLYASPIACQFPDLKKKNHTKKQFPTIQIITGFFMFVVSHGLILILFIIHSCPQLSKHSPDQCESVLPAALHQCHSEDLPEGRQRISLSQCHCLLHNRLPLPWITQQQLWYHTLFFHKPQSHRLSLSNLYVSVVNGPGTQMISMGIFQHSPSVPITCSLLRSVGVRHVG